MNIPLSLFRLQNLDTQISKIKSRLHKIEQILAQDKEVEAAQETLKMSVETEKNIKKLLVSIEDQVQAKQIKLKLTQASLFGGRISNSKELRDLQQEAEALKRTIAAIEEDQLAIMIDLEQAQAELQQAEENLKQITAERISKNSQMLGEKSKLESEQVSLESQRESITNMIPADMLTLYEMLIKSKSGLAVAEVVDDSCDACGAPLTPGDLQSARSPSILLRCRTCGRFLFKR